MEVHPEQEKIVSRSMTECMYENPKWNADVTVSRDREFGGL